IVELTMNEIRTLNFNLLKSLNALLTYKSVAKAAEDQYVTPPAMSLHLKRLREILNDDILIRGQAGTMSLTEKANYLIPEVQKVLLAITDIFETEKDFDLKKVTAEINIGMSSYTASIVVPPLLRLIKSKAPGLKLVVKNLLEITTPTIFTNREIDIALNYFEIDMNNIYRKLLFSDQSILIASPKHKVWKHYNGSFEDIKDCNVIVFTQKERIIAHPKLVHGEKKLSKTCKVNLIVSDLLVAIQAAAESDAVTVTPRRFAEPLLKQYGLIAKALNFPKFPSIYLYWHKVTHRDPIHQWLRMELLNLFKTVS
ncbi:MAG: LysR family transcriptional regulator, partial [Pseudomonadota bacterium]